MAHKAHILRRRDDVVTCVASVSLRFTRSWPRTALQGMQRTSWRCFSTVTRRVNRRRLPSAWGSVLIRPVSASRAHTCLFVPTTWPTSLAIRSTAACDEVGSGSHHLGLDPSNPDGTRCLVPGRHRSPSLIPDSHSQPQAAAISGSGASPSRLANTAHFQLRRERSMSMKISPGSASS